MKEPKIAITMGDPSGVGPETIVKAWQQATLHDQADLFVVGQSEIFRRAVKLLSSTAKVVEIESVDQTDDQVKSSCNQIPCLTTGSSEAVKVPAAVVDRRGGQAAYDAILQATQLALASKVDAVVTAPIHKAALNQAGYDYPGHTELLADLCDVRDFAMMLYLPPSAFANQLHGRQHGLGVIHTTLHTALKNVFDQLTVQNIYEKCCLANRAMLRLNHRKPKIGVCALNPHAGELGLFGDEEQTIIAPAVTQAKAAGIDIDGPFPADTLMVRAKEGEYDAVVAMYHDQGHIALKLLGMHLAVNITLGLPIIRTSVAHGTAFDLAWTGQAKSTSMIQAIEVAIELAKTC